MKQIPEYPIQGTWKTQERVNESDKLSSCREHEENQKQLLTSASEKSHSKVVFSKSLHKNIGVTQ